MSVVAVPAPAVKVTRSRRDQVLILVMAVLVTAGAFYLLGWKPQSAALSQARDERASAESQLAAASVRIGAEGEGDVAAAEAEEAADVQMVAAVPVDMATAEVLVQVDLLASQSGVSLGNITLSPPTPLVAASSATPTAATGATPSGTVSPSGPMSLSITMSVSGEPAATGVFMAGLATLPRLLVVDQVTIQSSPADAATGTPASQDVQVAARVFATGG